jgi:hypothetical protein
VGMTLPKYLKNQIPTLSCFQKGTFYNGIKIFNILPLKCDSGQEPKAKFEAALKIYK